MTKRSTQSVVAPVEIPGEIEPTNGFGVQSQSQKNSVEWLWLIWGFRRFLVRVMLRAVIASTIVAFLIPKQYQSTVRLMPPDQKSGSGLAVLAALSGFGGAAGGGSGLTALAGDMLGMKSSGALFVDILSGPTVQERIVNRFDLRKAYGTKYQVDARKVLGKNTSISEDRKSGVISITVTDSDRNRAAQIAEAYPEELDHLVTQVSTSSARREREFIGQRLMTVKRDLDAASQKFSEYASKNTAIDITAQGKAMLDAAARLEGEKIAAQSELEGLQQIYSDNNVRVRALRARIAELQKQLDKFGGLDTTPEVTDSNSPPQFPTIRQLPLLGVRWADLYRETKIQEKVFELLTQQYELAKIEEAKETPVVSVLDAANVPERKSFPPRSAVIILGTLLALAVAIGWVAAYEVWKNTDPEDPVKMFLQTVAADLRAAMPSGLVQRLHLGYYHQKGD